jgi:hypothetical protein
VALSRFSIAQRMRDSTRGQLALAVGAVAVIGIAPRLSPDIWYSGSVPRQRVRGGEGQAQGCRRAGDAHSRFFALCPLTLRIRSTTSRVRS